MKSLKQLLTLCLVLMTTLSCAQKKQHNPHYSHTDTTPLKISKEERKKVLTAKEYDISCGGTESPFTGDYWDNHKKGTYYCGVCGNPLYSSATKFESGTGWPSFYQPLNSGSIIYQKEADGRTEVLCKRCKSHLGHVFDDGPKPTGKRYCMNGNVLDFEPEK